MNDEINLLDYWRVLVKSKKAIILIVFIVTTCSVCGSYFLPMIYKAKATIMPIGGPRSTELTVTSAGQLGAAAVLGNLLPLSSSASSQIMAILTSRTMGEMIIHKYRLMKIFYPKLWDEKNQKWTLNDLERLRVVEGALNNLRNRVSIVDNKKTLLIEISVEMNSPGLAAEIADGYVKELAYYINENTFTTAKRNRIFIEEQLERNKAELLESGKELSDFYSTKKVSNIIATVDVNVSIKTEKNQTKADNKFFESDVSRFSNSPDAFTNLQRKAEELKKKVGEADDRIRKSVVKSVPQQVYLQYLTFRRELLGQVNALLTQQYEMAKIEETKEELNFQVIDWAAVPTRKFKPRRAQILFVSFVLSLFAACFYAFFREYLKKIKRSPTSELTA